MGKSAETIHNRNQTISGDNAGRVAIPRVSRL
jgi:hypothetical protein